MENSSRYGKIPDHFTYLLRNLYAGQEATIRTRHGTTDWFQIGKGEHQDCILSLCLFNLHAESIMWNAGLDELETGAKKSGRNINNFIYADDTTLMAESEEELKRLLMKVKEESEKNWLKTQHSKNEDHGIWSHHFMTNRWGNSGSSDRLYFSGLQNHCRWWLQPWNFKTCLLLGRKVMTNIDSILKSRDITFPTKVRLVKAMIFPVVMYGCESWTIKKTEHRRIDVFELCCWEDSWEFLGLQGDSTNPS